MQHRLSLACGAEDIADIMSRVRVVDGHWVWTGAASAKGTKANCRLRNPERWVNPARVLYHHHRGKFPLEMMIAPCAVPLCIHPDHSTLQTAQMSQATRPDGNIWKEACPKGHPYDFANTYHDPRGQRQCRACKRAAASAYYLAKKAAA